MTAVIAALLGASTAGLVSHLLARWRDHQRDEAEKQAIRAREQREKIGLLKLVHAEITNNLEYLKEISSEEGTVTTTFYEHRIMALKNNSWEQSRIRLAELVKEDDFEHLVSCYEALSVIKSGFPLLGLREDDFLDPQEDSVLNAQVKSVTHHHWLAWEVCRVETGLGRYWNKGMLISKPESNLSQLDGPEEEIEE